MTDQSKSVASVDYAGRMQANLVRVFGERDARRRIAAIHEIYAEDAVLYEPHNSATGHAAINEAVTTLLSGLPSSFVFTAIGPAIGHHDVGRLHWQAGPPNGPAAAHGMDIARFEHGRIQTLHVFLDPPGA